MKIKHSYKIENIRFIDKKSKVQACVRTLTTAKEHFSKKSLSLNSVAWAANDEEGKDWALDKIIHSAVKIISLLDSENKQSVLNMLQF